MPWIHGQASLEDWENRFPSCDAVPTVRCEDLSPKAFRAEFMAKNLPVMITGLTDDWRARREWVTKDGQPDVVAMSELFGDAKVLVVDCDEQIDTDLKRRELPFREFARWWRSSESRKRPSAGADAREKLYVKDWNFVRDFSAYRAYDTPPHVRDDWLNSSWSNEDDALCSSARGGDDDEGLGTGRANENENEKEKDEDDPNRLRPGSYRFVYCGVKGTWTPMHVDVARSYSRCCRKVSPRDVAARAASRFAALSLDPGRPDGTAEPSWSILTEHTWPRAAGAVCAYVLRRARAHATSISGGLAGWWSLVLDKVAVFRLRLCWVAVEPLVFLGYMVANPCDL